MPERLTPARLFSDPPLSRGAPQDLRFAPGGQFLTYRRAADDDRERMDLWKIELPSARHELWIDARELSQTDSDVTRLTAQERAERERRRQFSHGITQYLWHRDDERLLVPIDGQIYLLEPAEERPAATLLCPPDTRQSGLQLSPRGNFISYVRGGDLYITDLDQQQERRLTEDAGDLLTNGLPDFLAAEEMHRFEGHWWSPDEGSLYYSKVDEAPVAVSHRLELDANGARTIPQRYPYSGAVNPDVTLWRYHLPSGENTCVWRNTAEDAYLARVHATADDLLIQTQDRLQKRLTLKRLDQTTGEWSVLHEEHSDTWVNLHDDFRALGDDRWLLTSEAAGTRNEEAGTRHAIVVSLSNGVQPLAGPRHINKVLAHADDTLWTSGWQDTPVENHLFAIRLDGSGFSQLTTEAGWHECVVDADSGQYLDHFSNLDTPPQLTLRRLPARAGTVVSETDTAPPADLVLFQETFSGDHPYTHFLPSHSRAEISQITADDGQTLYYRLTPPAEIRGQHATIVYVYGGPGPQKARNEWSPLLVQLFAQNGFAVLELDNRGSGNRGRTFEAPIYRRLGSVEVTDQAAGLAALRHKPWADLSRVGVFGHSYGGYMALMCLAQASSRFAAGVAVAPVSDWALYDTHYTERYMGLPEDNAAGYESANVLSHLDKLRAPLLLMHGMADDNVLFTHSTLIMAKLQQLGTPFELMTYPGAKHSMQEREVSIHRFNMILDFFDRHLNGRGR